MNKIQRVSTFFQWFFQCVFMVLPILLIVFWIDAPLPVSTAAARYGFEISYIPRGIQILHQLAPATKMLGFAISLIPLTVNLCIVYFLIRLFRLFAMCEIFTIKTVRMIKYVGYALFIGQIINPIYQALLSIALTWHNPPGHRMISLTLSGTNIGILLIAILIVLISWIMSEGQKIQDDQKYTI